jgi:hypothetical protein
MQSKTYSRQELYAFLAELECYRIKKTLSTKEEVSYIDFDQYLIDQRACVRHQGYSPAICKVGLFEELTNKWEQLSSMLNKKAYAQAKEAEELAAMQP